MLVLVAEIPICFEPPNHAEIMVEIVCSYQWGSSPQCLRAPSWIWVAMEICKWVLARPECIERPFQDFPEELHCPRGCHLSKDGPYPEYNLPCDPQGQERAPIKDIEAFPPCLAHSSCGHPITMEKNWDGSPVPVSYPPQQGAAYEMYFHGIFKGAET